MSMIESPDPFMQLRQDLQSLDAGLTVNGPLDHHELAARQPELIELISDARPELDASNRTAFVEEAGKEGTKGLVIANHAGSLVAAVWRASEVGDNLNHEDTLILEASLQTYETETGLRVDRKKLGYAPCLTVSHAEQGWGIGGLLAKYCLQAVSEQEGARTIFQIRRTNAAAIKLSNQSNATLLFKRPQSNKGVFIV